LKNKKISRGRFHQRPVCNLSNTLKKLFLLDALALSIVPIMRKMDCDFGQELTPTLNLVLPIPY
jgi:hypothetical protein